jgi:hypothetical protein
MKSPSAPTITAWRRYHTTRSVRDQTPVWQAPGRDAREPSDLFVLAGRCVPSWVHRPRGDCLAIERAPTLRRVTSGVEDYSCYGLPFNFRQLGVGQLLSLLNFDQRFQLIGGAFRLNS